MSKADFKACISMLYEGRDKWEDFLERLWYLFTIENSKEIQFIHSKDLIKHLQQITINK